MISSHTDQIDTLRQAATIIATVITQNGDWKPRATLNRSESHIRPGAPI